MTAAPILRRRAIITLPSERILRWLGLPAGVWPVAVSANSRSDTVDVTVIGEQFDVVPEACEPPTVDLDEITGAALTRAPDLTTDELLTELHRRDVDYVLAHVPTARLEAELLPRRAAAIDDDPVVSVGPPVMAGLVGGTVTVDEAVLVTCTGCGDTEGPAELTDWLPSTERDRAIAAARRHANDHHDGQVVTEGWTR